MNSSPYIGAFRASDNQQHTSGAGSLASSSREARGGEARAEGRADGGAAPLGPYGTIVADFEASQAAQVSQNAWKNARDNRRALYAQQATAARLLARYETVETVDPETGEISSQTVRSRKQKGVIHCLNSQARDKNGVKVELFPSVCSAPGRARFGNLQLCGEVWNCPVCSRNIQRVRTREVRAAVHFFTGVSVLEDEDVPSRSWDSDAHGRVVPVMSTFTFRHRNTDDLRGNVEALKEAYRVLNQRRVIKTLRKSSVVGTIAAFECTWSSRNGWHPHLHVLFFVRASTGKQAVRLLSCLRAGWKEALATQGLSGNNHAFRLDAQDFQNAEEAKGWVEEYMAKFAETAGVSASDVASKRGFVEANALKGLARSQSWDVADELTANFAKRKNTPQAFAGQFGFTPWELLALAAEGEDLKLPGFPSAKQAGVLFRQFSEVMFRKNQLTWSRGLKALVGVDDLTDEECAEGDEFENAAEPDVRFLDYPDFVVWRRNKRKEKFLELVEEHGFDAAFQALDSLLLEKIGRVSGRNAQKAADIDARFESFGSSLLADPDDWDGETE